MKAGNVIAGACSAAPLSAVEVRSLIVLIVS
jgi:hypothetical protein